MEAANHQHAEEIAAELFKQYDQITKALDDRLRSWYTKYADENGVSYAEAQKALDAEELKDFKMTLEDYIQHGKNLGVDDSWLKAMKTASARHHVTRLEAIRTDFIQKANELGVHQHGAVESAARDAYTYTHDQEGYTVMCGTGYAVSFERVDKKRLETVLKKPWTPDGKNFSDRIWENKNKLISELTTTLSQGCVTGASLDKMSRQLAKRLEVSRSNAERLIATESAYFAAEGDRQAYRDLDVEYYEFLSTLDDRTTPICRQMDGKRFPITKFEPGVTAPPMHPRCRSTTIPYYPDDEKEAIETRTARDLKTGRSVRVPADISYNEWEKKYWHNASEKASNQYLSSGNSNKIIEKTVIEAVEPIDYNNKKAVKEVLLAFSEKYKESDREYACAITKQGNLFRLKGGKYNVQMDMVSEDELKDSIIIHNHPKDQFGNSGDCFSRNDFIFMLRYDIGEMYLVSGDGRYKLTYDGSRVKEKEAEQIYREANNEIREIAFSQNREIENEQLETIRRIAAANSMFKLEEY